MQSSHVNAGLSRKRLRKMRCMPRTIGINRMFCVCETQKMDEACTSRLASLAQQQCRPPAVACRHDRLCPAAHRSHSPTHHHPHPAPYRPRHPIPARSTQPCNNPATASKQPLPTAKPRNRPTTLLQLCVSFPGQPCWPLGTRRRARCHRACIRLATTSRARTG